MAGGAAVGVRWPWGARARKSVLLLHIASAGAWLGVDVVMAALTFTAVGSNDRVTKALAFQALELFVVWSLLATGLTCLATGIVLGLSSRWGVLRYWWVALKLALNLLLTGLVLVALAPTVSDAAERGRQALAGGLVPLDAGDLIFPPIVSPAALAAAFVLAVFKPWGRIRRRATGQRPPQAATRGGPETGAIG